MSRFLQKRGATVRATWAVKACHIGPKKYANFAEHTPDRPEYVGPERNGNAEVHEMVLA